MESGIKWLSDTPDKQYSKFEESAYTRSFTYALLRDLSTGEKLLMANTHIDYTSAANAMQVEKLIELTPRLQGASLEKQVPVYRVEGNQVLVTVGEVEHPMQKEHFIEWIALQTKRGSQCVALRPEEEPKAVFALREGDEVEAVYAYCNLHGFWKA